MPSPSNRLHLSLAALTMATLVLAAPRSIVGQAAQGRGAHDGAHHETAATTSSLRDFLVRKRAALFLLQNRPADQIMPVTLQARVTAESRSGVRRLRIREFQSLSDSARTMAGYNLGAGSWETQVAVLASAVADEFVVQAAAEGIPLDALDVVFTSRPDDATSAAARANGVRYPRNLQYTAYLVSPATDAQIDALRRTVEQVSPVLDLVRERQDIAHGSVVYTPSPATRDPNEPPGLRDFLVEKRAAVSRRQATEDAAPPLRAHARVEGVTGLRHVRVGEGDSSFQFLHDSPRSFAGHDLGPTVEEAQLGVMGTCLTHIYEIQAAQRGVPLDALELRLEATLTPRIGAGTRNPPRYRDIRYSVHIASPAQAPEIEALREAVEAVCPIYNLLKDPQPIEGHIVRERYSH